MRKETFDVGLGALRTRMVSIRALQEHDSDCQLYALYQDVDILRVAVLRDCTTTLRARPVHTATKTTLAAPQQSHSSAGGLDHTMTGTS